MENNNKYNQLMTIRHFISKSIPNRKTPKKFKPIKINLNDKTINTNHNITKSIKNNNVNKNRNERKKDSQSTLENNYYIEKSEKTLKSEILQKKLDSVDLIEKNTKNIYNWDILLSNPNLGLYYNKREYKKLEPKEVCKEQKNKYPKDPVVLVDLNENEFKKFFSKKSGLKYFSHFKADKNNLDTPQNTTNYHTISDEDNKTIPSQKRIFTEIMGEIKDKNKNLISHNIRPISIYSTRKPLDTFYFSNDFSDYYKQDLKTFSEKLTLLKARVNISNKKLMKEIFRQRIKSVKGEKQLQDLKTNVDKEKIKFKKLDLIIAGERKNVEPLLKSIHYQENPHLNKVNEHIKMYYKTMKPLGTNKGNVDYTKNDKWHPSREIKYLREKYNFMKKNITNVGTNTDNYDYDLNNNKNLYNNFNKKSKSKLILSYYNKEDPDIIFFNSLINAYNDRNVNTINDEDKIKENTYLSNFQNMKNNNYRKELIDKEFPKFPFIIEQFKQSTNDNENNLNNKNYNYFITEGNKNIFNEY